MIFVCLKMLQLFFSKTTHVLDQMSLVCQTSIQSFSIGIGVGQKVHILCIWIVYILQSEVSTGVEYCGQTCLCVCLLVMTSPVYMHVICGRGSVLLWWHYDMLCTTYTASFVDNIICSNNRPYGVGNM